jgi:hypothetical protein
MREARNFRLEDQVIQFLTGLMEPLPSSNKVYTLVIQEESNNYFIASSIFEHVSLVNVSDSRNKPQGR